MVTIKVVCGIIFKNDLVLICRRKPEKSLGGYWEFPGGKVEASESYEESLRRGLIEKLNLTIKIKRHFRSAVHHDENNPIELISLICTTEDAVVESTDHDLIEWVKMEELSNRKLAPAYVAIAQQLLAEYRLPSDQTAPKNSGSLNWKYIIRHWSGILLLGSILFSQSTKLDFIRSLDTVQSIAWLIVCIYFSAIFAIPTLICYLLAFFILNKSTIQIKWIKLTLTTISIAGIALTASLTQANGQLMPILCYSAAAIVCGLFFRIKKS